MRLLRYAVRLILLLGITFPTLSQTFGAFDDLPYLRAGVPATQTAGQVKASNWASRVVTNGGSNPTGAETVALATFWDGLVTDSIDTLMIHINHISTNSITAYLTPFLVGGGNDPWVARCGNNHTTTLSLTINGIASNGGNIATEDTGIQDATAFSSDNDGGVTLYVYTTVNEATYDWGYQNDALTAAFSIAMNSGGTIVGNCRSQVTGAIAAVPGGTLQGYYSLNRTGNTTFNLYFANSTNPHASIGNSVIGESGARAAQSFFFNGVHATDHGTACTGFANPTKTYSFFAIHKGLSSAQSALFYARIQTLRTAEGGGFR